MAQRRVLFVLVRRCGFVEQNGQFGWDEDVCVILIHVAGTSGDAAVRLRGNHFVGCIGDVTLSGVSGRVTSLELAHSRAAVRDGCPDRCGVTGNRCADDVSRCVNNYVTGACECSLSGGDSACRQGRPRGVNCIHERRNRSGRPGGCRTDYFAKQEFLCSHYINFREREMNKNTRGKCIHCSQLFLGKIGKFDATRCQSDVKAKCTKFHFRWGSAPDAAGGAYCAPQTP